ncbi:MAG: ATP-binding cassette domain-containing protein, partial [Achromobacter kerstersii]|uniref:ATP-binding cassette domain-containing protein n=1 Tax=Achromobacter kerstersii TaxID=1353890 RepID=UPI003D02CA99
MSALVSVSNLSLTVGTGGREIVSGVSFDVAPGEMVGIVGESGSGKTQAARAIMGLTPAPLVVAGGAIRFEGVDVTKAEPAVLRKLRGARIGMVFQEPMTSLNPSMPIGRQLDEGLKLHRRDLSTAQRRERILEMLRRVGIRDPKGAMDAWPHEFSGGMRQRMMLASVMLLEPALLIADEPTTALDAVVQRDVLELMVDLTREHHTAVLMISHDLPMVARYTERMVVMQHGKVLETGTTAGILERPQHPYTRKLLDAMPRRLPARKLTQDAPIVEVKNLVVDYAGHQRLFSRTGAKRALNGIDLHVKPREVVAVVGGSGSGKTTLGRAIAGLLAPTSGQILFRG